MEPSLCEPSEDLQAVYKHHALFHLSQQNHTAQLDTGPHTADDDSQPNIDQETSTNPVINTSLDSGLSPAIHRNPVSYRNPETSLGQSVNQNLETDCDNTASSQNLHTAVSTDPDAHTAKLQDINAEVITISEDSTSVDSTHAQDPSTSDSRSGFIDAEVVEGKQLEINAKTMTTGYFGSESSSFTFSNINEEASPALFAENVETADQFNNEGPTVVDNVNLMPNAQTDEIRLQHLQNDHEIPTIDTKVHPVKLSKSVSKPVKVPDASKLKVVDLMDLSSISELKRLWRKSDGENKINTEAPTKIKAKSMVNKQRPDQLLTTKPCLTPTGVRHGFALSNQDAGISSVKAIHPKQVGEKMNTIGQPRQASSVSKINLADIMKGKAGRPRKDSNKLAMTPVEKLKIKISRQSTHNVAATERNLSTGRAKEMIGKTSKTSWMCSVAPTESNMPAGNITENIIQPPKDSWLHSLTPLDKIKAKVGRPVTNIKVHGMKPGVKISGKIGRPRKDDRLGSATPQGMMVPNEQKQYTSCKPLARTVTNNTGDRLGTSGQDLKKCSVKLNKVECLDFSNTGITVDWTVSQSAQQRTKANKTVKSLSKKTVTKVTNYVAKSVGLTSKTAKKEVTKFTMKAIKKVNKKIKKGANTSTETVSEDARQPTTTQVFDRVIKQEPSDSTEGTIEVGVCETDATSGIADFDEGEMDFLCDSSDDYIPSDEEFRPSKTKTLKDVFLKSKKRKRKNSQQGSLSKKIKVESSDVPAGKDDYQKPKRKYVRRTIASKRIGRPPVLGLFQCKNCPFTASEKNLVEKHARVEHARTAMPCRYCDAVFYAENTLLEHEARKHTNDKPFKCQADGCDYASKCMIDLQRHQSKHATEKSYVCKLCGWTTKWRRNLRSHHLMKHSDERKFKCPDCSFRCKRNSDLKQHMFRHSSEKPISCLLCGFHVKTNWELRSHMLSHNKEKPFKCTHPGCTAGTKTQADLNKHMRVHATARNFICEICSKGFKCQQSLNKHYAAHTDVREFTCDVCGNKFKTKAAMKKHMSVHSGIKPFSCDVCGMRFSVSSNMKSHSVTHDTTNRPFLCPLCPHAARKQEHLLAHIGSFHGNSYTYFCEFCKKPFARYGPLKIHYKRMHPELDLSNMGHLDLNLLKMEMKQELENAEETHGGFPRILKKKGEIEMAVKVEPPDDSYRDFQRAASEVKEDTEVKEETGKESSQRKGRKKIAVNDGANMGAKASEQGNSEKQCHENIDDKDVCENSDGNLTGDNARKNDGMSDREKSEEKDGKADNQEEFEVVSVDDNDEDSAEEKAVTGQAQILCSSSTAKLVVYKDFRLPLATKGFEFNYDKSGKKPKAWFMNYELMNEKDSAKQKKYLRRIGVLPPLPKGKPRKNTLLAFVNRRRRKLTERIRQSNLNKEEFALKVNAARKARFHGNYREFETFETLTGNELTESEVKETFGQVGKSAINEEQKTTKKNQPGSVKKTVKGTKQQLLKKKTMKTKDSKQKAKPKVQKKVKGVVKGKVVQQKDGSKGKTGKKSVKMDATVGKKSLKLGPGQSKNAVAKQKNSVSSQKRKANTETSGEKPKYNKMYVPVKKRKITKESKKTSKDSDKTNKNISKNGSKTIKKTVKQCTKSKASPKNPQRKKLKVKIPCASPCRQFDEVPANTDSERSTQVVGSVADTTNYLDAPFQHLTVKTEQITYPDHILSRLQGEPEEEVSFNQSEAALVNEQGVMLNRVVVLKTVAVPADTGNDEEEDKRYECSENDQTIRRSADRDSRSSEQRDRSASLEKASQDVSVKTENGADDYDDDDDVAENQVNLGSFVIMDAETGQIKESLNVHMNSDEFDDSGIHVKEEPEDELEC